jgi:hypothetical protein
MSLKNYALDHDKSLSINTPSSSYASDFGFDNQGNDENWYSNSSNSPTQYPSSVPYGESLGQPHQDAYAVSEEEDYANEPPLLEELGIRFDHIWSKTHAVITPTHVRNLIIYVI